jgi:4-hydroxy-tetrahydrodipicolinate synthase
MAAMFREFTGCGTAIVTPFRKDLSLEEDALRRLVRRQIAGGINYVVPCGTTGESPTLTHEEHLRVVAITLEEAKGKVPVLAGAGGCDTRKVIDMVREIERLGADGILSVTPYYNKPGQEGLYQHYKAIASAISLPIVLYNVPPRTNVNIDPATLRRLAAIENIIGVKEASGSIAQMTQVIQQVPEQFHVLSGDDAVTLPLMAMGGRGIISVAANEIPAEMTSLAQACLAGDFTGARALQRKWMPLMEANFIETNPTPVKAAMAEMGLLEPVWRLPLVPPKAENLAKIHAVLESLALLERAHVANRA